MKITFHFPYKRYIEKIKTSRKLQIALACFLLVTTGITVYAVQQIQQLRSQARVETEKSDNGLSVTNDASTPLPYEGNNTYTTNTLEVKLTIDDLEKLVQ